MDQMEKDSTPRRAYMFAGRVGGSRSQETMAVGTMSAVSAENTRPMGGNELETPKAPLDGWAGKALLRKRRFC